MFNLSKALRDFHTKNSFPIDTRLKDQRDEAANRELAELGERLCGESERIKQPALLLQAKGDERLYRAHLMIEELGETLIELARQNYVGVADGLGDLQYVVEGTASVFGIPMPEVLEEIHRSNMSKKKRDPITNPRMRDKGPNYSPPDIVGAIVRGKQRMNWEATMAANEELSVELQRSFERTVDGEFTVHPDKWPLVSPFKDDYAADGLPPDLRNGLTADGHGFTNNDGEQVCVCGGRGCVCCNTNGDPK